MESSYKQGAAFSVSFTVVGKVFSFINSLLIAFYFGADAKTDIYFYLVLIAAILSGWLQGINISVVVPEFMHIRQQDTDKAVSFANFFIYIYFILSVLIVLWCWLLPSLTLGAISAFPKVEIAQNLNLVGLAALYFTSFFVMTFLTSLVEAYKLFKIYFLTPLNTILALVLLIITKKLEAIFIGYIIAYTLQVIICLILLKRKAHWHFAYKKPHFNKKFIQNFIFHQPNNIAWAALLYVPLFLVSAASAGMVSAVNYSRMLSDSLVDVFVSKVNNVAKVKITDNAACKNYEGMALTLKRTDTILMLILVPVCVFSSVFSLEIVNLFFLRGSFTPQDALNTALFLKIFILSVPLISLHNNLTNLFAAMRLIKELVPRYMTLAIFFIILFIAGIKNYGAFAYPVIFLTLYVSIMLLNIITARQFVKILRYASHMLYMAKLFTICFICALGVKYMFSFYQGALIPRLFINGLSFVMITGLIFYLAGDIRIFKEALNLNGNYCNNTKL